MAGLCVCLKSVGGSCVMFRGERAAMNMSRALLLWKVEICGKGLGQKCDV